ncbi:class I SAM-dependent methyltransferase [Pontibacter sp. BT310]|uniref:Class I SAM-dependent methyltransferase n=1 Tax=Pontibacter populi TaxID=890055 RepID=A0ABS6XEP3_9BACT|nr:class I SAM-dependent methyltransferase [Pontibacter sp. BT310]MBW3365675.1 class I SAM-dependent methyltransferase [Pontibacter populi]
MYEPEFVKGLFNRMSSSYERVNYITSFGFSIRWRRQFLQEIQATEAQVEILDMLTGMGETWEAAKKKLPYAKITALDFSEGMLKHAERKNNVKFRKEVSVIQQDILQNQLPESGFDYAICAFELKTFDLPQVRILATETKRVLKPGGQFSFIEVSKPESKLLQFFYGFYLGKLIPILGKLLLGNPREYRMLWQYTERFQDARDVAAIFKDAGLEVSFKSYFYGCATGFTGYKKA